MPLPFYADFESFKINDKEMLECAVQVQDTCTHHFKYHVRAAEKLNILAQLRPHRYEKKALRSLLLAASSETLITEDLVDGVLSAPELKQYIRESE